MRLILLVLLVLYNTVLFGLFIINSYSGFTIIFLIWFGIVIVGSNNNIIGILKYT